MNDREVARVMGRAKKKPLAVAPCPECNRSCEEIHRDDYDNEVGFKCWHCDIRFTVPVAELAGSDPDEAAWLKACGKKS